MRTILYSTERVTANNIEASAGLAASQAAGCACRRRVVESGAVPSEPPRMRGTLNRPPDDAHAAARTSRLTPRACCRPSPHAPPPPAGLHVHPLPAAVGGGGLRLRALPRPAGAQLNVVGCRAVLRLPGHVLCRSLQVWWWSAATPARARWLWPVCPHPPLPSSAPSPSQHRTVSFQRTHPPDLPHSRHPPAPLRQDPDRDRFKLALNCIMILTSGGWAGGADAAAAAGVGSLLRLRRRH